MNEREAYERLKADSYTVDYAGFLQRQSDIEVLWQALTAQAREIAELRGKVERLGQNSARYEWLRTRMVGAHFDFDDEGMCVLAFEIPDSLSVSADCDATIDRAIEGAKP